MTEFYKHPPSLDDMDALARLELDALPHTLSQHLQGVVLTLSDFPDEDVIREMALESPFDLLGLYRGVALGQKSIGATPQDVDMIFLYRRPILDYWAQEGDDLRHLVRHVLIHEIGHHFGFSDEDMAHIEREEEGSL